METTNKESGVISAEKLQNWQTEMKHHIAELRTLCEKQSNWDSVIRPSFLKFNALFNDFPVGEDSVR